MRAIHLYDDTVKMLFLNNGKEIKLDFDARHFKTPLLAKQAIEKWAKDAGVISYRDSIAMYV